MPSRRRAALSAAAAETYNPAHLPFTTFEFSADGKSITVKGLVAAGVTAAAKTQDIDLLSATGKTTIKLEVVNSKVETIAK